VIIIIVGDLGGADVPFLAKAVPLPYGLAQTHCLLPALYKSLSVLFPAFE
jgi:hypothetical protein